MIRKIYSLLFAFVVTATAAYAQVGAGSLKGTLTDINSGEALPFVNVVVEQNGNTVSGGVTDFDGKFYIKPLTPGSYDLKVSSVGYKSKIISGIVVSANKITFQDVKLEPGVQLDEIEIVKYTVPLIDKDGGASGGTVSRDDIAALPTRSIAGIASTVGGVSSAGAGGGLSVRGARSENTFYYIDGIKVRGSSNLPKSAIQEVSVITGGVPANYGDATGGIISITTRGPSSVFYGGIEGLSSGFKLGENVVGLDAYGYNLLEAYLAGPILFKKDSAGAKDKPLLGFFVSGNYRNSVDNSPSYIGSYKLSDDKKAEILASPLVLRENSSGSNNSSEYVRKDDLVFLKTKENASSTNASLSGKIDVTTTPTINLTFGGSMNYNKGYAWSFANSLFNSDNNELRTSFDWRVYGRFTQRFVEQENEESSASVVKNAFYSVMVDYSKSSQRLEDDTHGDNYFNYGHIGYYDRSYEKTYANVNSANNGTYRVMTGYEEVGVTFTPSDKNTELASFVSGYFNLYEDNPDNTKSFLAIQQNGGLLNGQNPNPVYTVSGNGMWNNYGLQSNRFAVTDANQFRVTASGSADIGDHAITLGVEYEQRVDRVFSVNPVGLWTLMRLNANSHVRELDNNPDFSQRQGDSTLVGVFDGFAHYDYDYRVGANQTTFDENLRLKLGLDPDGTDQINIDNINPELFSLDMFSAEDLLNDGNSYISYYGYDYKGDKLKGKPSFSDFFTEQDEFGNLTRPVAPFEPIYMSGFIMDKFALDDIVFNVGLRIDRYDANQKVLSDPYLMRVAKTAGEVRTANNLGDVPTSMGDDYIVYVDDFKDPNQIRGYRDGEQWFNAQGQPINDPKTIRGNSGEIQPYLVDPDNDVLSDQAFKDYVPQVNPMPRISFSFPISDEAVFFAHYDILTQRPTSNSRLDPTQYLFADQITYNNGINNPNLKPTRTIDYEFGFQQALNKSSALKIAIFYRDMRDMIQARSINEAYPRTYITFDNVDFGTIKGTTISYDLRKTGNVTLRASYTLQFASGTGSSSTTGIALARTQSPNLRTVNPLSNDQRHRINATFDYRYGAGKDYNGPEVGGKKILERTGINFITNLGSGTPYSARLRNGDGQPGVINGSLNGSRLPWEFTTDFIIDKSFPLKLGKNDGDAKKPANLNVYLMINNLFNTQNIYGVHSVTGNPDDDGFLESAQAQLIKAQAADPQSYDELYRVNMNNPGFYGAPRTIRLGASLNF
jgi:outer membrane receptor protein involved in Fe transport